MGFLQAFERRTLENPSTSLANPAAWLKTALGAETSTSGISVTEASALNYSIVYACINVLSKDVAQIEFPAYRATSDGGRERARLHPVDRLLHQRPNMDDRLTPYTFKQVIQAHMAGWGNGYWEIERDNAERLYQFWPLPPDKTRPVRIAGKKMLVVTLPSGEDRVLKPGTFVHLPGLGYDGIKGYSVIRMARNAIGAGMAQEAFGAGLFARGARPSGVISHPTTISPTALQNLRESVEGMYSGLTNAHRIVLLEEAMKWEQMSFTPEDSQFIESQKLSIEQCARYFDIPLVRLGHSGATTTWGSGVAEFGLMYLRHTLNPWLVLWEEGCGWELFTEEERAEGYYVEFLRESMLRGDPKARGEFYQSLFSMGVLSPNMIARRENLPTHPDGDERYVPLNYMPVSQVNNPPPEGSSDTRDSPQRTRSKEQRDRAATTRRRLRARFRPLIEEAAGKVVAREAREIRKAARQFLVTTGRDDADDVARFVTWAEDYYGRESEFVLYMRRTMQASLAAYADAVATQAAQEVGGEAPDMGEFVGRYLQALGDSHSLRMLSGLRAIAQTAEPSKILAAVEGWAEDQARDLPARMGDEQSVKMDGAVAVAVYAALGWTRKVWSANADACPICLKMDGRTASIERPFLSDGDEVDPENGDTPLRVKREFSHAPLHRGCACSIVAG